MEMTPTVYIVDEDALARSAVCQSAGMMNLRCEEYASGQAFLDALDPSRPGCVLMELKIPDLNGFELQRRLASQAPALPVVFITRHATVSTAVRAMRAGAMHVLQKPVREHELFDVLQEAMHRNQQRRSARKEAEDSKRRVADLTAGEQQLMEMIVAGESTRAIAARLGVCVRTVELRRARLKRKLKVQSLAELLQLALTAKNGHSLHVYGIPAS
jgi:FixJ family two-component response regulator